MISSNDSFQSINLAKPAGYIYKITNLVNGKVYVGQTVETVKFRWSKHKSKLRNRYNENTHLQSAWNKYGESSFTIETLDAVVTEYGLDNLERFWIKFYDSMNPKKGYNKESGGSTSKYLSESTKEKLRQANLGKKASSETKAKISASLIGNKWNIGRSSSAETKKKLSIASTGRENVNKGKTGIFSSETIAKMSFDRTGNKHPMFGKHHSIESKEKSRQSHLGKKCSDETKFKMSKSSTIKRKVFCITNNIIYNSITQAAKDLNINRSGICNLCAGRGKSLKGYKFKYYKEVEND